MKFHNFIDTLLRHTTLSCICVSQDVSQHCSCWWPSVGNTGSSAAAGLIRKRLIWGCIFDDFTVHGVELAKPVNGERLSDLLTGASMITSRMTRRLGWLCKTELSMYHRLIWGCMLIDIFSDARGYIGNLASLFVAVLIIDEFHKCGR